MISLRAQVDTSHEDMIHDAQVDYYGTRLATCSSDKTVKVFELIDNEQKLLATLTGHEGPVWQLAWAHPKYENLLASCSYDKKVIIWKETQPNQWTIVHESINHDSSVNSVCWAPAELGLILAAGSSDGTITVLTGNSSTNEWDVKKIQNAHSIGCNSVSWAPVFPSSSQSYTPQKRIVSGGCDNLVKIWLFDESEDRWIEEQKLEAHSDWVRDVAWAPATGLPKTYIASCSQDRRVIMWTKSLIPSNSTDSTASSRWTNTVLNTFDDVVWHVSWSIMGNILAVSGGDNKVSLWKETPDSHWVCLSGVTDKNI